MTAPIFLLPDKKRAVRPYMIEPLLRAHFAKQPQSFYVAYEVRTAFLRRFRAISSIFLFIVV